jgi:hypothetical protein
LGLEGKSYRDISVKDRTRFATALKQLLEEDGMNVDTAEVQAELEKDHRLKMEGMFHAIRPSLSKAQWFAVKRDQKLRRAETKRVRSLPFDPTKEVTG